MKLKLLLFLLSLFLPACLSQGTNNPSASLGLLPASSTSQTTTIVPHRTTETCLNLFDTESAYFYAIMNHFNGLFFGDFTTGGAKGIYGPLAVGGTASIPLYSIDKNIYTDCNSTFELDRLGFSATYLDSPAALYVAGDVITGNQPDYEFIVFGDPECSIKNESNAPFQFDALFSKASYISQYFAGLPPTHRLVGNELEQILNPNDPQFYVLHFGPCEGSYCQDPTEFISDASQIFLGDASWGGPINGYPDQLSIVFNIGIVGGKSFTVTTGSPNAGLSACRAFFNFYSVDPNDGSFLTTDVTLVREGQGFWGGTILNLWGGILDGPDGNFGGQVVGKDYGWLDEDDGADILDYFELGETCTAKSTCWLPVYTDDLGVEPSTQDMVTATPGVSLSVLTITETITDTSYSVSTTHSTQTTEATVTSYTVSLSTEYSVTSTTTTTLTYETTTLATSTGTATATAISTITLTVTAYTTTKEDTTTETTTTEDVTVEETSTETVNVTDHATIQSTLHYLVTDVLTEDTTEDEYETVTVTDLTNIEDFYTTTTTTTIEVTTYFPAALAAALRGLMG